MILRAIDSMLPTVRYSFVTRLSTNSQITSETQPERQL
jgi:hypothetical protein